MSQVIVTRAGFLASVQDLGRVGHRQSGVSTAGALDRHALRIANLLVGNDASAAGLEMTLGKLRLRFTDDRLIAWCGGAFEVKAAEASLSQGRVAVLREGDELILTAPERGARAWLAISGGIDVPVVLGTRATDLRGGFGGLEGRTLRDGDVLNLGSLLPQAARIASRLGSAGIATWAAPNEWANTVRVHGFLRVMRGAEWRRFEPAAHGSFLRETFAVTAASDRMGVRMEGSPLRLLHSAEMLSEAVAAGTIQVPPIGQPILLLGDCQTIGGYPKIAHVITVDLPAAAQLRPGDEVRFVEVTLADAQRWLLEREREVEWFRVGLELQAELTPRRVGRPGLHRI